MRLVLPILLLLAAPLLASPPETFESKTGVVVTIFQDGENTYFLTTVGNQRQMFTFEGGIGPIPPTDEALTSYIKVLTKKVKAKDYDALSLIFFRIAGEIDAGTIGQATEIGDRTRKLIFGPEKDLRPAWAEWWNTLNVHLLRKRGFDTPDKWAAAYRVIGKAVKP